MVWPAPIAFKIRFNESKSTAVIINETTMSIKIEWTEALSAFGLLSSPRYFDKAKAAPEPKPFPKPTRIMKIGVKNPTPARASAPRPDTQKASIKL